MPTVQVRTPGNLLVTGGNQDRKWKLSDENFGNDTNFCEQERYCEGETGEKVSYFLQIIAKLILASSYLTVPIFSRFVFFFKLCELIF